MTKSFEKNLIRKEGVKASSPRRARLFRRGRGGESRGGEVGGAEGGREERGFLPLCVPRAGAQVSCP